MRLKILIFTVLLFYAPISHARSAFSGIVVSDSDNRPIAYAVVAVAGKDIWTTTDKAGKFSIGNLPKGESTITISCIGMVTTSFKVSAGSENIREFRIRENNLKIDNITVSGVANSENIAASYKIDRLMLEHAGVNSLSDISALLPGGQTVRTDNLATESGSQFFIRSASGEAGNPAFGTVIEVDGVRLGNNSSMWQASNQTALTTGADTRNIGVANIESVEVTSGLASVEYGDMSTGMVKVRTNSGRTPFRAQVNIKPRTKLYSVGKGIVLGKEAGVLNADFEYARSSSDIASPHTTYDRNSLTFTYSNTFNKGRKPVRVKIGAAGNIGGYDQKSDPDLFTDTYTKSKANTLRTYADVNWLLRLPWLTSVEARVSGRWSDNTFETRSNNSGNVATASMHSLTDGYYLARYYDADPAGAAILIPPGYWYYTSYRDDKPVDYTAKLKAKWSRDFGGVRSSLMIGAEYTSSGNGGRGLYYDDTRYAPTWREHRYDKEPFMNNLALYIEETLRAKVGGRKLEATAGLRSDMTHISKSEYGIVSGLSPRIKAKYTIIDNPDAAFSKFTVRTGIGKSVKLPSFHILFPTASYSDRIAFTIPTTGSEQPLQAYYTSVSKAVYNPDLKWQSSIMSEIGAEAKIYGISVSLSAYANKTRDPYIASQSYTPYKSKLTQPSSATIGSIAIPAADRVYSIDPATGIVTVSDRNGVYPTEQLPYIENNGFKGNTKYINGSPSVTRGLEWIVDFGMLKSLRTSLRVDGKYHYYKGVETSLQAGIPSGQVNNNTNPKYVAYYIGGSGASNGFSSRKLNTNIIVTTHIPKIRLVVSARLEATLVNKKQNLSSERDSFGLADPGQYEYFPGGLNIYTGNYAATYPLYYSTHDDMGNLIPFAEKLAWAYTNDRTLYDELRALVEVSNNINYFKENSYSAYFSANISVTKEIGDFASISFNAVNFLNNMGSVRSSQTGLKSTLYNGQFIPEYYYGISLKLNL